MTLVEERFWSKVARADIGCWEWEGARIPRGYGRFKFGRRVEYAHRVAYTLCVGPIPEGLHIDHLCRNTSCVRPDHLEPVTHAENVRRGISPAAVNARKTHCKDGHELTPENSRTRKDGKRYCLVCARAADHIRRPPGSGWWSREVGVNARRIPGEGWVRGSGSGSGWVREV